MATTSANGLEVAPTPLEASDSPAQAQTSCWAADGLIAITPHQAFEVARVLDRFGDGVLSVDHDGRLVLLVDRIGGGCPDLALELDPSGRVVGRWSLTHKHNGNADLDEQAVEREPEGDALTR